MNNSTSILRLYGKASFVVLVALAAGASCRREGIAHARVVKSNEAIPGMGQAAPVSPQPAGAPIASGQAPAMEGEVPLPPPPMQGEKLVWSLPKGWSETKGAGMRYATLQPPAKGKAEVSVIRLAGDSGGELANVNRWRGQIGLGPVSEAALSTLRTTVSSKAGPIALYDFTSEGQTKTRMVVGMLVNGASSWFLKLNGEAEAVAAAQADFATCLGTLRLE